MFVSVVTAVQTMRGMQDMKQEGVDTVYSDVCGKRRIGSEQSGHYHFVGKPFRMHRNHPYLSYKPQNGWLEIFGVSRSYGEKLGTQQRRAVSNCFPYP
jgi:hypothetical protein